MNKEINLKITLQEFIRDVVNDANRYKDGSYKDPHKTIKAQEKFLETYAALSRTDATEKGIFFRLAPEHLVATSLTNLVMLMQLSGSLKDPAIHELLIQRYLKMAINYHGTVVRAYEEVYMNTNPKNP